MSAEPELPVYLLPAEVASMLRLSLKSVYAMAANDPTMPMVKVGGSIRFPRERLLAWLRAREQGHAARPMRRPVRSSPKAAPSQEPDRA